MKSKNNDTKITNLSNKKISKLIHLNLNNMSLAIENLAILKQELERRNIDINFPYLKGYYN